MRPEPDKWSHKHRELRRLLTEHISAVPASSDTMVKALLLLDELEEIYRSSIPAPAAPRSRKRKDPNAYRVVKDREGAFLEETFSEGRLPFRVEEPTYFAAAEVIASLKGPASFEEIFRKTRKTTGNDELPDYRVRACIRLWYSGESPPLQKTGTRYAPRPGTNFKAEAKRIWRELLDKSSEPSA